MGLEKLTGRKGLELMTSIPLRDIVSSQKLLKKYQSWCPQCYHEWQKQGSTIYQPLIWSFLPVETCMHHNLNLISECPHCNARIPLIPRIHVVGYCPKCLKWLGDDSKGKHLKRNSRRFKDQQWFYSNVENMLMHRNSLNSEDIKTFRNNIGWLWEMAGSRIDFRLYRWANKNTLPQIDGLLQLSKTVGISVIDLFKKDIRTIIDKFAFNGHIGRRARKRSQYNRYVLENCLQNILNSSEDPFPSVSEIARRIECNAETLRYHCPELCSEISTRHFESMKAFRLKEQKKRHDDIRAVMLALHEKGQRPKYETVKSLLPKNYFGQHTDGYRQWRQIMNELGYL